MVAELSELAGVTVNRIAIQPGAARILEAEHAVAVDSPAALTEGDDVTFTDPDLGTVFVGRLIRKRKTHSDGEGVSYECADLMNLLPKTAATVETDAGRTGKIAIAAGTSIPAALNLVLSAVAAKFPGGVEIAPEITGQIPALDRGGQTIDTWVEDILSNTTGGIAYVDPNDGNPKLVVEDYFSAPAVQVRKGEFNLVNPNPGELVLAGGEAGASLAGKVAKLTWEGAGRFKRHRSRFLAVTYPEATSENVNEYRFYLPPGERAILTRYIEDGECKDGVKAAVRIGGGNGLVLDWENPGYRQNNGNPYFFMRLPARNVDGSFRKVEAWFDYTSWDGPLVVSSESADPRLDGEKWEIHEEFFVYEDDLSGNDVSHESIMQALVDARHSRSGNVIDEDGSYNIHIKGLNPNLKLGSPIVNLGGGRVQSIEIDVPNRDLMLRISNKPIRRPLESAKAAARVNSPESQNWDENENSIPAAAPENCFAGWREVNADPVAGAGGPAGNAGGGGWAGGARGGFGLGGRRAGGVNSGPASWECLANGECVPSDNPNGRYRTETECLSKCAYQWDCDADTGWCFDTDQPEMPYMDRDTCDPNCTPPSGNQKSVENDNGTCVQRNDASGEYADDGECAAAGGQTGTAVPRYEPAPEVVKSHNCESCGSYDGAIRSIAEGPGGKILGVGCLPCAQTEVVTDVSFDPNSCEVTVTKDTVFYPKCQ